MKQSMFDTLLSLPLFQGLGHSDLTRILESTRLKFTTVGENEVLLRQDEACTGLLFLLDGELTQTTLSADRSWNVEETMATPAVEGLEVLYGSNRTHRHTLKTCSETHLVQMDKRTVGALIAYFEVFRLNVLNLLTSTIVRREQHLWLPAEGNLKGRLRQFMRAHVHRPAGTKCFHISQQMLSNYLGEDKRRVSRALHEMQEAGLLLLDRRAIKIPSFEHLLSAPF